MGPWLIVPISTSKQEFWGMVHRRRTPLKLDGEITVNWKPRKTKDYQKIPEIEGKAWKRIFNRHVWESMTLISFFQSCLSQICFPLPVCSTFTLSSGLPSLGGGGLGGKQGWAPAACWRHLLAASHASPSYFVPSAKRSLRSTTPCCFQQRHSNLFLSCVPLFKKVFL